MVMLKSIEEEWTGFAAMVIPTVDPSSIQFREMRKSFFAGAWVILCALDKIGDPDTPDEVGVNYIKDRQQEGRKFYRELVKEYSEGN